jgi:hypothetical protein
MRSLIILAAIAFTVFCACVPSVKPEKFAQLTPGMPEADVLAILGPPASTGMDADGSTVYEYREYRYSWIMSTREQVAVYSVKCKDGKLVSYGKAEGATFRPGVVVR